MQRLASSRTSYTARMWGADSAVDRAGTASTYAVSGMLICAEVGGRAQRSRRGQWGRCCVPGLR